MKLTQSERYALARQIIKEAKEAGKKMTDARLQDKKVIADAKKYHAHFHKLPLFLKEQITYSHEHTLENFIKVVSGQKPVKTPNVPFESELIDQIILAERDCKTIAELRSKIGYPPIK